MIATPIGKAIFQSRRSGLIFLLRDDFTTQWLTALITPRTATPGPGTLTITDTNNKLSVASGKLTFATGGAVAGDPGAWGAQLARAVGLAVLAKLSCTTSVLEAGWDSAQSGTISNAFRIGSGLRVNAGTLTVDTLANGTDYNVAVVQRTSGLFFFIKGGAFTNWTLIWVDEANTGNLYPGTVASSTTAIGTVDFLRALQLPTPFATDYGLATQRLAGARSAGDTFTHEANCVLEYTVTNIGTGSEHRITFREQDVNNFWRMIVQPDGDLHLTEMVAGSPTVRASSVAGITNGQRIVFVADGTTIRGYSNNVLRFTYSSASNFLTATSGRIELLATGGGAVSDIISWPRTLSGATATLLDDAINGVGTFLLNDEFTVAEGGAIPSPRTAEPGPGTLTITDTNNKLSVASGKLSFATGGAAAGDPGAWGAQLTRRAGLAVVAVGLFTTNGLIVGWDSNQSGNFVDGLRFSTTAANINDQNTTIDGIAMLTSTSYSVAIVQRGTGFFALIKGGIYTNWTLAWVGAAGSANYFPELGVLNSTGVGNFDSFRVLDLPAPFATDYGLATQRLAGARAELDAFVHEANCVIECVMTTFGAAGNTQLRLRAQDANNYWEVVVNSAGNLILNEIVAGSSTNRANVAAAIVGGHRIVIVADGTTIRGYSNNVLRWTYSSASNFSTATSGQLSNVGAGSVISDIISWPRTLSGAAAALLDQAVN